MEIVVPKTPFKNAIALARKALSSVVIQEERGHLLFVVRGPRMVIQATNNDLKARCTINITNTSGADFSFTADPKILEKLVSKVEVNDVYILFDEKDLTVKVYTTSTKQAFGTLQSFPPSKMLTFDEHLKSDRQETSVNKEALLFALKYAQNFLAGKKEDQKNFDFVIINKGIVYAANGSNKLGLIVFKTFEAVQDMKIRKLILPVYTAFVSGLEEKEVKLIETDKDIGVESLDGNCYFSFLKSKLDSQKIPVEHLKSEGAYTKIDKDRLLKVSERATITNSSATQVGLELTLTGSGDSSSLEIKLVSKKEAIETMTCSRVNDGDQAYSHIVDFRMLKAVLGSFSTKEEIRLHINDNNKFFKIYSKGEVDGEKYILAGVGAYAKIVS